MAMTARLIIFALRLRLRISTSIGQSADCRMPLAIQRNLMAGNGGRKNSARFRLDDAKSTAGITYFGG